MPDVTITDLKYYRSLCAELVYRIERLKKNRRHVFDTVQDASQFPFSKHNVVVEGDVYSFPVVGEYNKIAWLKNKKQEVEKFVERITDDRVRRIVDIYFMQPAYGEKPTWEDVARQMDDGSTGDACRMKFIRYMDEN